MRVLHVIPSLDKRDGGPSFALPLMARSLAAHGIEVEAATTLDPAEARERGIALGERVEHEGCRARFFPRQTRFYKASLPLGAWLRAQAGNYDVIHNHALFSYAPLAGASAARRARVPYLMRPLGLLNAWGMENRRRWIKALSYRCLDRPALQRAAAIHYTSAQEEREAARLGLGARSAVIPLGIDFAPFRQLPSPEKFFDEFPGTRGRRVILFLSRLDPKKGVELLLEAFAAAGGAKRGAALVIAGNGPPGYLAQLQARAAEAGIAASVTWAGFLDGERKLAALAAASLYVLPSYSENFGIALLEAMAAGRACIASDQVALATEPGSSEALCVTPCDAAALTGALGRLLDDDAERAALAAKARRLAEERYSLEAMGSSLAALYRELTADNPPTSRTSSR